MVEIVVMAVPSPAIGVRSSWLRSRIRNWPQHCSSSYDGVMYLLLDTPGGGCCARYEMVRKILMLVFINHKGRVRGSKLCSFTPDEKIFSSNG